MEARSKVKTIVKEEFMAAPPSLLRSEGLNPGYTPVTSQPGDLAWIPLSMLMVNGAPYQRESVQRHVQRIAKNWKWENCVPITICLRDDNAYNIIDGQHRVRGNWSCFSTSSRQCGSEYRFFH